MPQMSSIAPPPPIDGPAPRLDTIDRVESILRAAHAVDEGPLSLAEIKRRMGVKSIRHNTIKTAVAHLSRFGVVTVDAKNGVMWTLHDDPAFWRKRVTKLA